MPRSRLLPVAIASSLAAVLAALVAVVITTAPAGAVAPTELQIAFSESVEGNTDIYLRDPAGTRRTRRTQNPGDDYAPSWSPVGDRFAYVRKTTAGNRFGRYHLRVQSVTTDQDIRLMSETYEFGRPAWTNDAQAVIAATPEGLLEVPVDNPGARRVIGDPGDDSTDPVVDPASSNLVVSRPRAGGRALAVINGQGGLIRWLTDGASIDTLPTFTPDGAEVYLARRAIGQLSDKDQIYRVAADGSQAAPTAVTTPLFFNYATSPSLSPDGTEMVFEAAQGGFGERMYVLQTADVNDVRFLALGAEPAWRPEFDLCEEQSQIPESECDALVALYQATDGSNWTRNDSWLVTLEPCRWRGVRCSDGRVTILDLSRNSLTGSIPPEIGQLPRLRQLRLGRNSLAGSIPPEIGHLTELSLLEIHSNSLTGPIPPEIGQLTMLQSLRLEVNSLSGPIPPEIGELTALQSVGLAFNSLSGPIPPELGQLTAVTLSLQGNFLSGPIPPEIGEMASLRFLLLRGNGLSGLVPDSVPRLPVLETLTLSGQTGCLVASDGDTAALLTGFDPLWDDGC